MLGSLVLTGCGGGGGGSAANFPVTTTGSPPAPVTMPTPLPTTSVSAPALNNFTVSLSEDTSTASVGGAVTYTLRLQNTSSSSASVIADTNNSQSVPKATLRITDPNGVVIYPVVQAHGVQASHDVAPPPPPTDGGAGVILAPGEQLTPLTRILSVFSVPGTYQAQATFSVAATPTDPVQTVTLPPLPVTIR